MKVQITSHAGSRAILLTTNHAHALLIPKGNNAIEDGVFSKDFTQCSQRYVDQGYCTEDAATLALMNLSGERLDNPRSVPKLIDQDLESKERDKRFFGMVFKPLKDAHPGIYPIVDQLPLLEELLAAGARIIQLRIKAGPLDPITDRAIGHACRLAEQAPKSQLFINDYWQSALHHGAYGIHLGQEDLLTADLGRIANHGVRLGVSSHAFWEVARAMTLSPSYVACGPIFPTRVKAMPWIAQGIDNLRYWSRLIPHPVVAIGGINQDNLADVRRAGASSASVINAIVAGPSPAKNYGLLQSLWESLPSDGISGADQCPIARPTLNPDRPWNKDVS